MTASEQTASKMGRIGKKATGKKAAWEKCSVSDARMSECSGG
jgi:hypothetical protein